MSALRDEFLDRGVVRVESAFSAEAAAAIADTVWSSIERRRAVRRDDPSTWPSGGGPGVSFKHLKGRRVFEPVVRSERLVRALDEILGAQAWVPPKVGAQILFTFPAAAPWVMPNGWHIDGDFDAPVWPPPMIRMFSCVDTVAPEGGGTLLLEGSHRLVERYLQSHDTPIHGSSVSWTRFLRDHAALDELRRAHTEQSTGRELVGAEIDVDGVTVRPVEVTGAAGDVYLAHFYVLHSGAPNVRDRPRLMLSTSARNVG